ncbi:RNA-directed DNA polymerase from mobile element jockey [Pitangus sulphuratus]|nr:RNA-directed DNA polymerase from mobile element jockey [Pitangus sulphuratus]
MEDMVPWDMEKTKVVGDFLLWSFLTSASTATPKSQKAKAGTGRMKNHLLVLQKSQKVHKPVQPDEMRLWFLRELCEEATKPLSITFEKSWQTGEVPMTSKGVTQSPFFRGKKEDLEKYRPVSFTLVPGKIME